MLETAIVVVIIVAAVVCLLRTFFKKGSKPCPGGCAACDRSKNASSQSPLKDDKCPEAPDSSERH